MTYMLDKAVKLAMFGESDPEIPILSKFLQRVRLKQTLSEIGTNDQEIEDGRRSLGLS